MTHPPQPPPGDPQPGPYKQPGYGQQPPGSPQFAGAAVQPPNAPGAVASLVLGLIGVFLCQLCAPFAFFQGRKAEAAVEASGGAYGGRGIATAGKILGIVGMVFLVISILVILLVIITGGISASYSTS